MGKTRSLTGSMLLSELFPVEISFESASVHFAKLPEATFDQLGFHDNRYLVPEVEVPFRRVVELLARVPSDAPPMRYVFHTAFCGSTLLAKLLKQLGAATYLEPSTFTSLAILQRMPGGEAKLAKLLPVLERLLACREPDKPAIAKLHNCCGGLWPALSGDEQPAILIWSDLQSFLVKALKRNTGRPRSPKRSTRSARKKKSSWAHDQLRFPGRSVLRGKSFDVDSLTYTRAAALLWASQMDDFFTRATFPGRTRTIEDVALYRDPQKVAFRAAEWLGMTPRSVAPFDAVLGTHAKGDKKFDARAEALLHADMLKRNRKSIDAAMNWLAGYYPSPRLSEYALL